MEAQELDALEVSIVRERLRRKFKLILLVVLSFAAMC